MTERRTQTEPTMVIPRDRLPPVSTVPGPTIEQLADIARARRDYEDDADTMVPCPTCAHCPTCGGHDALHMVSPTRAALSSAPPQLDEPGDEP